MKRFVAVALLLGGCSSGSVHGGSSGSTAATGSTSAGSTGSTTGSSSSGGTTGSPCATAGACGAPAVQGLADDPVWHRSETFALQCSEPACTFRYAIDASATGSLGSEAYQAISQVVVNPDLTSPSTPSGSWYLHVQAQDPSGAKSPVVSAAFKIDVTPPTAPGSVSSGLSGSTAPSNPQLTPTWSASSDGESGLAGYQVALVRLDDGYVSKGPVTQSSGDALAGVMGLQEGAYAVRVLAVDNVGNTSAPGDSATFNVVFANGDSYSDDPNLPLRNGQPTFGPGLTAIPTFHSIGLYWSLSAGAASDVAHVQFRPSGTTAWRAGLDLWFDPRDAEYRGSLVLLKPGTAYEVQVALDTGETASTTVSTWSETFPVGQTITAPAGTSDQTLTINQSGTPQGYLLITADPSGSTIDQGFAYQGTQRNCVDVYGSYVIVRGLTLRNCQGEGVEIHAGAHDVVIEDNDISGFGPGPGGEVQGPTDTIVPGYYEHAGVFCRNVGSSPKAYRLIVQRNKIHDPRYGSISWNYAHPNSDNAIFFGHCGTNNVFRYNEVYAQIGHYYGDGIGGSDNFTFEGFPNADSDIYGNIVSDCYDDAIEADGANRNVRIWGNYLHHVYNAISQASNSVGPGYTFRNIVNETGGMNDPVTRTPDGEDRAELVKVGETDAILEGGRYYVLHNTILQPPPPPDAGLTLPMGEGEGVNHSAGTAYGLYSRNNIFTIWKSWWNSIDVDSSAGPVDADYDLYNGGISDLGSEAHGMVGTPTYHANLDPALYDATLPASSGPYRAGTVYLPSFDPSVAGDFTLSAGSPGLGAAQPLANFNDAYASPDVGAHQSGTSPMQFGVDAYPNGYPDDYQREICTSTSRQTATSACQRFAGSVPEAVSARCSGAGARARAGRSGCR